MIYAIVKLQCRKVIGQQVTMIEVDAEVIDAVGGTAFDAYKRQKELEDKDINRFDYVYIVAEVME